jgi:phosphate transport system permease protein
MSDAGRAATARRRRRRRDSAERRFRAAGAVGIALALAALAGLLASIVTRALPAFGHHEVSLEVAFDEATLDPTGARDPAVLSRASYASIVRAALADRLPEVTSRGERRELGALLSTGAANEVRERVLADPGLIGTRRTLSLPLSDEADLYLSGTDASRVSEKQAGWLEALRASGVVERRFARRFFENGDSREPELAGVRGAILGSLWTVLVTLLLSFPLGVAGAAYLEEFAPRSRWTELVEVNINNLAAVPSIVFGLLGLALFLNFFGLPRSAPVAGGMVLALMTLPTILIASRSAIQSVPPTIREAALAIGASPLQVVTHHVLPLALPGMLTGAILGLARALGETAPLLMIGMVAFIADVPKGPLDPATVLPVQIFLWADSPERAFVSRTSAAIVVLLALLMAMNLAAVLLRNRFERRW